MDIKEWNEKYRHFFLGEWHIISLVCPRCKQYICTTEKDK